MKCVELRHGEGSPLFVLPGVGGQADELSALFGALRAGRPIVALEPLGPDGEPSAEAPSVEAIAERAVALIRARQPFGPYHLVGYSFGGLVALEVAESLRAAGESVPFVGLLDAIYDRRYWPTRVFLSATARRTARHLRALVRRPPAEAWAELRTRSGRLARRLAARVRPDDVSAVAGASERARANYAAMASWRPRRLAGPAVVFTSGGEEDFACDPADLWRRWLDDLDVRRVPGSHLDIIRDPESVAALARALDSAIDSVASPSLRVLLATTFGWESSCRLALELADAGCVVEAVAPPNSGLHHLPSVVRTYRLDLVRPLASLGHALESSRADLVIPFDDRTRQALHQLYEHADPTTPSGAQLRERIVRSLGPPETYPQIYSRAATMALAAESGLRCPPTAPVANLSEVLAWMEKHGGAGVLKTDGSWGGREVAVVRDARDAGRAWRRLSRPPGLAQIAKRLLVDRDPWPLRARVARRRPTISAQAYVEGRPGNVAAACVDGKLLGAVQAEVMRSDGSLGPSTVIRVIEHPEMLATTREMVRRLGLTGLCGFDFVLESGNGRAYLVEVNPRATPTAHLLSADGVDLITSLRVALGHGGPPARTCVYPDGLVALFPQEMQRDPNSPFLTAAYHDVPSQSPELVAQALAHVRPARVRVGSGGRR